MFSVIVPVYNSEKYIERCILSITSQYYKNYELILIDDGSIDNSGTICKNHSSKNDKIKYVFKENNGPASARNVGLKNAVGDYILFLDSDDRMCEGLLDKLNEVIKDKYNDIYLGTYMAYNDTNKLTILESFKYNLSLVEKSLPLEVLHNFLTNNPQSFSIWRHTFKREMLEHKQIRFDEDLFGPEDGDFFMNAVFAAKTFSVINIPFCYYTIKRDGSIITKRSYENVRSEFDFSIRWYSYFKEIFSKNNNVIALELSRLFANIFLNCIASSGRLKRNKRLELKNLVIINDYILSNVFGVNKKISVCIYRLFGYIKAAPIINFLYTVNTKIKTP
jgi:glycosyltransferase involved in cell wall biosynthesis